MNVKKRFLLKPTLLLFVLIVGSMNSWGQTTATYTFTSKEWGDSQNAWTCGKGGFQCNDAQGLQVSTSVSGANATTKDSFTDVSKIVVTYNTNQSKGAGSVAIQIGSNAATTNSVGYSGSGNGSTADYTTEFNYATPQSGKIKITVNCTTNSIYIKSVAITYGTSPNATTVSATISSSGFTTLSSEYALDFSGAIENLAGVYVVSGLTATSAKFTPVTTVVPAETGLVLQGTAGETVTIPIATTTPEAPEKNLLKACVNGGTVASGEVYAMGGGEFKLYTGTELPVGKAYLLATDVEAAGGTGAPLSIDMGGGTTGIGLTPTLSEGEGAWYDLSGRRVENPTKGMYIHNGKKVAIK